jgi:hypothetical protein
MHPQHQKKSPFVPRFIGEISTNDAFFHEQAATSVAAAASQSEILFLFVNTVEM